MFSVSLMFDSKNDYALEHKSNLETNALAYFETGLGLNKLQCLSNVCM